MEKKEGRLEPRWDRIPHVIKQIGADLTWVFAYWSCERKIGFVKFWLIIDILVKRFGQKLNQNVDYSRMFSKSHEFFHAFFMPVLAWKTTNKITRLWC